MSNSKCVISFPLRAVNHHFCFVFPTYISIYYTSLKITTRKIKHSRIQIIAIRLGTRLKKKKKIKKYRLTGRAPVQHLHQNAKDKVWQTAYKAGSMSWFTPILKDKLARLCNWSVKENNWLFAHFRAAQVSILLCQIRDTHWYKNWVTYLKTSTFPHGSRSGHARFTAEEYKGCRAKKKRNF